MVKFKGNQLQKAIFSTLGAEGDRATEIKFRLKRLLAADRGLGRLAKSPNEADRHYAFFEGNPPGTGADLMFTHYEVFALLAATMLLEHGLPQSVVVKLMRQVRKDLELAQNRV